MKKILVAEDEREINACICRYLESKGYETISVYDGLAAMQVLREQKNILLVLLDILLPLQSGDMVLKKVREFSDVPVIIVSAKDTVSAKIEIISMGADDYITKPFDLDELYVRIGAVLRRAGHEKQSDEEAMLCFKNLVINTVSKTIYVRDRQLNVTGKEYGILELLLKNPNKLFSKANLFESVWGEEYLSEDNTLKVHMSNIRNKLRQYDGEEYIETVWGMGYRLKN